MSENAENQSQENDPTRLCPVCRMPISILAVRCRFCGAEVGRPRKEQETFTVKDLGGEQRSSYTLSGNVTEALEAFISEERSQAEAKERERQAAARKSIFRRQKEERNGAQPVMPQNPGLPELDAASLELASSSSTSTKSKAIQIKNESLFDTVGRKAFVIAALVAGLILLYFCATFTWPRVRHLIYSQSAEDDFIYPNRAEALYSAGLPLVEVLEEALTALRHNNTEENKDIAEKMRRRFIEHIEAEAFAKPFDMHRLNNASKDINRAGGFDSNAETMALMEEINREVAAFKFILTKVDTDNDTATFRLNNPYVTEKEQIVSAGDMLQDHFLVKSITPREVRLEDMSVRGAKRQLIARYMAAVEALER